MPYLSYEMFEKFAHPAILEHIYEGGYFDEYESVVASAVYQITKIDVPDNPDNSPKWLIGCIVALLQKAIMNKMQNVSNEFREQINNDYERAITELNSFKSKSTTNYSTIRTMDGMYKVSDL